MAKFDRMVITDAGAALNTDAMTFDRKITFTKIAVGSGTYTSTENLTQKTALKNQKQIIDVSSVEYDGTTVRVRGALSNEGVTEAYTLSEIGLYAKMGNADPIMYAITVASQADTIPAYDNIYPVTVTITLHVIISNTNIIQTTIYSGAYASARDLIDVQQKNAMIMRAIANINSWYSLPMTRASGSTFNGAFIGENLLINPVLKLMNLRFIAGLSGNGSSGSMGTILKGLPIITYFLTSNSIDEEGKRFIPLVKYSGSPNLDALECTIWNTDDNLDNTPSEITQSAVTLSGTLPDNTLVAASILIPYKELSTAHPFSEATIVQESDLLPDIGGPDFGDLIANDDGAGTITLSIGGSTEEESES